MNVHELKHFAFGDDVGGIGQDLHHAHVVAVHHHLEGARVEKVADQHAGRVAKNLVGRAAAAPQGGFIDHVVMQQGGRMDEFDHGGQIEALLPLVAQGAAGQQQQNRAQAFAAGRDDVARHFANQWHAGVQPLRNGGVNLAQVIGDESENFLDG